MNIGEQIPFICEYRKTNSENISKSNLDRQTDRYRCYEQIAFIIGAQVWFNIQKSVSVLTDQINRKRERE